jgi:biotin carboxyl carrier protein
MTEHKDIPIENPVEKPDFDLFTLDDFSYETHLTEKFKKRKPHVADDPKKVYAFIPGKIRKVHIKKKSKVKEGEILLVLEAMKMNNNLFSPMKGVVKEVYVTPGLSVAKGALLLEFK